MAIDDQIPPFPDGFNGARQPYVSDDEDDEMADRDLAGDPVMRALEAVMDAVETLATVAAEQGDPDAARAVIFIQRRVQQGYHRIRDARLLMRRSTLYRMVSRLTAPGRV